MTTTTTTKRDEPRVRRGQTFLAAVVIGLVLAAALSVTASAQKAYDVVVDTGQTQGKIRNIMGLTCGPTSPVKGWYDLTSEYRWLRTPSVRIHDCSEIGDIHHVFPDFKADVQKTTSYDFTDIDRYIAAMQAADIAPFYRLGYSWTANGQTPSDYDKFAEICHHIVLHFTQGWASGFHYDNITWEVWNEANLKNSWSHTAGNFYQFYDKVARAVRRADPAAKVGTCALAVNWPRDFQEGLIAYCAKNQVPFDFYSWHYYGWSFDQPEPYDYARQARWVRYLLDRYGLHDVENYQTEWNVWHPGEDPRLLNLSGAAYCLSAAIYMHNNTVDMAYHYRGDVCDNTCGGLFVLTTNGSLPITRAHAFRAFALMLDTPVRVKSKGSDRSGFAVLAGRSEDGKTHQVLLSDFWSRNVDRRVFIRDLKPARRVLQVFSVDQNGSRLEQLAILEPDDPIEHRLPPTGPWIQFLKLDEVGPGKAILFSLQRSMLTSEPEGEFRLLALGLAGRHYIVLGGLSGSRPGTPLPGDQLLPLNLDPFTFWLLGNYHKPGYDAFMGILDQFGSATISWHLDALDPKLRGADITFAAAIFGAGGVEEVTNSIVLTLN